MRSLQVHLFRCGVFIFVRLVFGFFSSVNRFSCAFHSVRCIFGAELVCVYRVSLKSVLLLRLLLLRLLSMLLRLGFSSYCVGSPETLEVSVVDGVRRRWWWWYVESFYVVVTISANGRVIAVLFSFSPVCASPFPHIRRSVKIEIKPFVFCMLLLLVLL